jgi:hypothetical protein
MVQSAEDRQRESRGKMPPVSQGARNWSVVVKPAPFSSFTVSMVALTAARIMARLSATLIVLTLSFTSFPSRADSEYKKVCKIGVDLKVLAEDGNANSCRSLAIASNLQEYQLGCQNARDENLVMLTAPINIQAKSARVTSASLSTNAANANQNTAELATCAKFWESR